VARIEVVYLPRHSDLLICSSEPRCSVRLLRRGDRKMRAELFNALYTPGNRSYFGDSFE
jgi:hypothetical protein